VINRSQLTRFIEARSEINRILTCLPQGFSVSNHEPQQNATSKMHTYKSIARASDEEWDRKWGVLYRPTFPRYGIPVYQTKGLEGPKINLAHRH